MTEEIGSTKPIKINYRNSEKPETSAVSEREPVKRILSEESKVIQRRKPLGRKIAETFTGDQAKNALFGVVMDVIIPQAKDMIMDAGQSALHRIIYQDAGPSSTRRTSINDNRSRGTAYNRMYVPANGGSSPASEDRRTAVQGNGANLKEIILDDRGDAEEILDGMLAIVGQYGTVSISELKEMLGVTAEFTDAKWGWKNLGSTKVTRVREGYLLDLPRIVSLDT
jgi:hypothetical protein